MKKRKCVMAVIALLVIACILAGLVFFYALENSANEVLLKKLAIAIPGLKITEIKDELGSQLYEFIQLDEVLSWGIIEVLNE